MIGDPAWFETKTRRFMHFKAPAGVSKKQIVTSIDSPKSLLNIIRSLPRGCRMKMKINKTLLIAAALSISAAAAAQDVAQAVTAAGPPAVEQQPAIEVAERKEAIQSPRSPAKIKISSELA